MRVGIITIGNELLSGFTVDRNAAWIGQQLLSSGIKVNVHHTIPDDFGVIYDTLEYQFREWRCDQIIVTGCLGPTVDDITVSSFLEFLKTCSLEVFKTSRIEAFKTSSLEI